MSVSEILSAVVILALASFAHGGTQPEVATTNGTWKLLSAELAGKPWPQEILDSMKLILKDDAYTVLVGEHRDEGTVKRDPTKSPKTMDITGVKGPNEGKTFLCIYELNGDELRVCYDLSGKSRPTEFATKAGTLLFLVKYQRTKP